MSQFNELCYHWLAGGVAGGISRTLTAPLDRLKIVMQVQTKKHRLIDCWRFLLRKDGVVGMWRGNFVNVLKVTPETGLKFSINTLMKQILEVDEASLAYRFVPGIVAATVAQTTVYPLELLKTQIILRQTTDDRRIVSVIKQIYLHGGIRSFYRGYSSNIVGFVPYHAIELTLYDMMMKRFSTKVQPGIAVILLCSCTASLIGQAITYPLSVVKTRLQAQVLQQSRGGMVTAFYEIFSKEGVPGLYRGLTANNIKVLPAVAITYIVYESLKDALGIKRRRKT